MGNCAANAPQTPSIKQIDQSTSLFNHFTKKQTAICALDEAVEIPCGLDALIRPENASKNVRLKFKWQRAISHDEHGSVHAVTYRKTKCALKCVPKADKDAVIALITEAKILSGVDHPGILGFVDVFVDEKYLYLAMERADFDLDQLLRTSGPLDETWTRSIIYSLLQTIAYLHSKDIAHCNLKPSNIMWSTNLMTLKLIEFGDSKYIEDDETFSDFISSPSYMAPERWNDHKGWQLKKSDVWAIGAIAYEMFIGEKCFEGIKKKRQWAWPEDLKPSDLMQDFIQKCLTIDAGKRVSAEEALEHPWYREISTEK